MNEIDFWHNLYQEMLIAMKTKRAGTSNVVRTPLQWGEVLDNLGIAEGEKAKFARLARLWRDTGIVPASLIPEVSRRGRGTTVLYSGEIVPFLQDALQLREYGSLQGQHHSLGSEQRLHAGLQLLLAARRWPYAPETIRGDVLFVTRRFKKLVGTPDAACQGITGWLFLGKRRGQGSKALFGPRKLYTVMSWWSVLANAAIRPEFWKGEETLSWDKVENAIQTASSDLLMRWLTAAHPLVTTFCHDAPRGPQTIEEFDSLITHPPTAEQLRKENITTHIFRALNRRLDKEFATLPDDVERWQKEFRSDQSADARRLKKEIARSWKGARGLPLTDALGRAQRWTWYDGRLYDGHVRDYVYQTRDWKAHLRPSSIEEVLKRFFRYLGVFAALAVATTKSGGQPVPSYEPSRETALVCGRCRVPLHLSESDYKAVVQSSSGSSPAKNKPALEPDVSLWCPSCFDKRVEKRWMARGFVMR